MAEVRPIVKMEDCPDCEGEGYVVCEMCDGSGQVEVDEEEATSDE